MDLNKLYRELVRRNVFRAVVAYLAVAWVLVQIASIILPAFAAPAYLLQGFIYLLAIGLVFWTGFSWVYDLTPQGVKRTPEKDLETENRQVNIRRLNTVIVGSGILAFLLLLAGSFWAGSRWTSNFAEKVPTQYSLAVLPFEDRSDNADFGYLSEGIAEDVIGNVFHHPALSVLSSQSTFRYGNEDLSIEEISGELHADVLLTGSYAITQDRVEVRMEVINGKDASVLNYTTLSGKLTQINSIVTRIGLKINEALGLELENTSQKADGKGQVVDSDAYKFNALGKSALRVNAGQTRDEIIRYFEAAIAKDSTFVDPYIGIAEAYIFDVNRGYMSPAEAGRKIISYVLKAEKLEPGSGRVSAIMGILRCFEYDFHDAISYFEIALEKSPNFLLTYHWYPGLLQYIGEFHKAELLEKKAGQLDPLNDLTDVFLAKNYLFQGKISEAWDIVDNKLSLDPDNKQMLWMKAILQVEEVNYEGAYKSLVKREVGLETGFISGYVFAKTGQVNRAEAVLQHMASKRYVPPTQKAIVLCGLERYEEALEQLEEAFLLHDQWVGWALFSSMTEPIKKHPRYLSLFKDFAK